MPTRFLRPSLAIIAATGLVVGLTVSGGAYQRTEILDAGPAMTWTNQFLNLFAVLVGLLVVGTLITYGFLVGQAGNELSPIALAKRKYLCVLCLSLAITYIFSAITTMGTVLGTNFQQTLSPGVIQTYIWDLVPSQSFLISASLALVVAVAIPAIKSLNAMAALIALSLASVGYPLFNSHSISLGNHSLAITASVTHGIAMSIWVGTVPALYPFIKAGEVKVVRRFSTLATICLIALLISGIVSAVTRMGSISDLLTTGYGLLVLAKIILFGLISYTAINVRKSLVEKRRASHFVLWELVMMGLAVGVGVALQFTAPTRIGRTGNSAAEDLLGFNFPPPPNFQNYFFGWHPDWLILTLALVASALYVRGIATLKVAKIYWPALRTISFFAGIAMLIWVTCAGIAKYAMVAFSAHMIQHMVLAMIVPIFLVLSAPITLALRVLPTNTQDENRSARFWIISLLHSRYSRLVTNPLLVLFIFTASLYGTYFTSIFSALMSSHVGHIAMEMHFLITGILFSFLVIGVDPAPRKLPYWAKLLLVLVSLSVHAFFALAIMQSGNPIGVQWYSQVQPPWIKDALVETHNGGGIAWAIGEIPMFILLLTVAVQWSRADARVAKQKDRAADRDNDAELARYNEHLTNLNKEDGRT